MKAKVQYNDFVGTAAADKSDHTDLTKYLQSKGVDTDMYKPVGARLNFGDSGSVYFDIICENTQTRELIKLGESGVQSFEEFASLFKRFEIIVTKKSYLDKEINETFYYEDVIKE